MEAGKYKALIKFIAKFMGLSVTLLKQEDRVCLFESSLFDETSVQAKQVLCFNNCNFRVKIWTVK